MSSPVVDKPASPPPPSPTQRINREEASVLEPVPLAGDATLAVTDDGVPFIKTKPVRPTRKGSTFEPDPAESDQEHRDDDIIELKPIKAKAARGRRMRSPSTATTGSLGQNQGDTPLADALIKAKGQVDDYQNSTFDDKSEGSDDTKLGTIKSRLNGLSKNETGSNKSDDSNAKISDGILGGAAWGEKGTRRRALPANGAERHIAFDVESAEGEDDEDRDEDASGKNKKKGSKWSQSPLKKPVDKLLHFVWLFLGKPEFGWIKPRLNWNDLEPVFRVGLSVSRRGE